MEKPQTEEPEIQLRPSTVVRPSPQVLYRNLGEESILLDLESGFYFGLNDTGTKVWQLIASDVQLGDIRDRLSEEFEVAKDHAWRDLAELISALTKRGLVTHSSETSV